MWSHINNVIGRSPSHDSVTNDKISPDLINDFFQNVAILPLHSQTSAACYAPSSSAVCSDNAFLFDEISPDIVLSHLSNLDVKKSMGPDGLSTTFLKTVANKITVPLTSLYNQLFQDDVIPTAWKQSSTTAIHKGGPLDDPSNYRPISVVPIFAKILEKIVSNQLIS